MTHWDPQTATAYADLGEQGHVEVLWPTVSALLGDLSGKRVLDFGCGPGQFSVLMRRQGAGHVHGIDESIELIRAAQRYASEQHANDGRMAFGCGDESALPLWDPVDAALCSLTLMMCESRDRLRRTVRGLVASTQPGGRVVIAVTHPCFRGDDYGTFHYDTPEGFSYWASGQTYDVVLEPGRGERRAVLTDYHWTLSDYVNTLTHAGATLREVRELPARLDAAGHPIGPPAYLVLAADNAA
ncbi:MAG: methyltransferase domain-containing protein [Phycisphaera sp.]|nr:methyltransferase domain-containing protein [Phycisphaera sp.]